MGGEVDIGIGDALLGQNGLGLGDGSLIAAQGEGIDADDTAALLGQLLMQGLQLGQLAHAGIAGGEPEIHHGDGVLGEQVIALDGAAVEVLALEGRELLHLVAVAGGRGAVGRDAVTVARGLGSRLGELGLNGGQGALDLPDLLASLAQQLQLVGGKLVLGGLNGVQQEITVVLTVLLHGHALVGGQEHLLPKGLVFHQNGILLVHQGLVHSGRLLGVLGLAVGLCHVVVAPFAAGGQGQHQQCSKQQHQNSAGSIRPIHFHLFVSSLILLFVCSVSAAFVLSLPSPKP